MSDPIAWHTIEADPAFRALHARKSRFLWGLLACSVTYYFLLPVGAALFTDWFRVPVWGPINAGLVFALSQFAVAWGVAAWYVRRASAFDAEAAAIAARHAAAESTP